MTKLLALAFPLTLLVGCSSVGSTSPGGDDDDGVAASGRYAVTTHFDLSKADGLSASASASLEALTNLSDDPAGTILALVDASGGGAADFLDDLPDFIRTALLDWVNQIIADRQFLDAPVAQKIVGLADDFATVMTDFAVESELALDDSTHELVALSFDLDGGKQRIASPVKADAMMAEDLDVEMTGDRVDISDHDFDLPIGQFAVAAIQAGIAADFGGADLAGALNQLVDCDALAPEVANQCFGGGLCIGNQANIRDLCVAGLGQVADQVLGKIAAIGGASLTLHDGTGVMGDASIVDGRWNAGFVLGGDDITLDADFDGVLMD